MARNEVEELRRSVEALEAHWARKQHQTEARVSRFPYNRRLDWPTFTLAVIGAAASIAFVAAAVYPVVGLSYKHYFGG